jgi:cytochrome P450
VTDVVATVNIAFAGGAGTTSASSASGLYLLLTNPALRETLRSAVMRGEAGPLQHFVEETVRLYGPVLWRVRVARQDLLLGSVEICAGDTVIVLNQAAGRDPARYRSADEVELGRRWPRDHFGFQKGARACVGQALGRLNLEVIFGTVLERLEQLRLDPDRPPPSYEGDFISKAWQPLHALFEPAAPAGAAAP